MNELLDTATEYACQHVKYQAIEHLSMFNTPPPVVVKSNLVANVALGMTLAVLAAVVQFSKKILPTTTFNPAGGV
jgi:hypothetical protein